MFEYLNTTTSEDAFPAVHHSIQYMRQQWSGAEEIEKTVEDLTPTQAELVKRIIHDIETTERMSVWDMSYRVTDEYTNILTEKVQQLSTKELRADPSIGINLLTKLRGLGKK